MAEEDATGELYCPKCGYTWKVLVLKGQEMPSDCECVVCGYEWHIDWFLDEDYDKYVEEQRAGQEGEK